MTDSDDNDSACRRASAVTSIELIEEVKKHPSLYSTDFIKPDVVTREKIWRSIAQQLVPGFSDEGPTEQNEIVCELKKKWRNLKDYFLKDLRRRIMRARGVPVKAASSYMFFDRLLFLKPMFEEQVRESVKRKVPIKRLPRKKTVTPIKIIKSNKVENDLDLILDNPPKDVTPNIKTVLKDLEEESIDNNISNISNINNCNCIQSQCHIDEDKTFLLSLVPSFRRMSYDQKMAAKVEVLNVIRNINSNIVYINQPDEAECVPQPKKRKMKNEPSDSGDGDDTLLNSYESS